MFGPMFGGDIQTLKCFWDSIGADAVFHKPLGALNIEVAERYIPCMASYLGIMERYALNNCIHAQREAFTHPSPQELTEQSIEVVKSKGCKQYMWKTWCRRH